MILSIRGRYFGRQESQPYMQNPANIKLQLLGRFRLYGDGDCASSIRISARKSCALLAYLAMHPERSVNRTQLATLLWADRPDKLARHSLRQCLASLRADLAPFAPDLLHLEGDTVELRLPATAIDANALAVLADSADLADLARAGDLYRGAFLADVDLGVETFNEWVRAERSRLEALVARVYEACAEGHDGLGQGGKALEAAERLVALDPLREDWQRLSLRLEARYRGRESALAQAAAFTSLLKEELDIEPSPSTLALVNDIRRSTPAPSPITLRDPVAAGETVAGTADIADVAARRSWRRPQALASLSIAAALVLGLSGWLAARDYAPSVELAAGQRAVRPGDVRAAPIDGFLSIAVLPFVGEGKDGPDSIIADRFTDDLIDELSRATSVRVVSEQTMQLYRGRAVDVAAVSAELGVRYVIEGRVRRQDDQLRISTALIDGESRLQVWSDRSEHPWPDNLAAQDEIARGLARALYMHLVAADSRRAARQGDPGVDDLLAQGWAAIHRHNPTNTTGEAKARFAEVLRRDPDNVTALIGLGAANVTAVADLNVPEQEPYLTRAEELLNRAIARNPESAGAFYWLGVVQKMRGQFDEALASFAKAVKFSPSMAPAYAQAGHIEAQQGRGDEGMAKIRYAIELDPKDTAVGRWCMFAGQVELERGHFDAAIDWLSRAVAGMPRNPRAHASLAAAYALAGNMGDAAKQVAEVKKLAPGGLDQITRQSAVPLNSGLRIGAQRLSEGWRKALAAS
ncbi:MAG: BTAD domain-containing putative transcriptional regulator [Reyranellales bacterium]